MIITTRDLIDELKKPVAPNYIRGGKIENHKTVYRGCNGKYYTGYGGQEVHPNAINRALQSGLIKPEWDDKPNLEVWRLK